VCFVLWSASAIRFRRERQCTFHTHECTPPPTFAARESEPAQPYSVPNTEVRQIQSSTNNAVYQLFIATPADYATAGKKYPVVYMLDADYSFALTRNVVQHFAERGKLPPMILVAIAYQAALATVVFALLIGRDARSES
jgi:enterochelin esterase-like enzyme